MDRVSLGRRIALARSAAKLSQGQLADRAGLDRSAVSRVETGDRRIGALELAKVATVLARPITYFLADPVPAVVSRRSAPATDRSSDFLDIEIESFAIDIRLLHSHGYLGRPAGLMPADSGIRTPRNHDEAEQIARKVREHLGLGDGPLDDLDRYCDLLGLHTLTLPLGEGVDGGCSEVVENEHAVTVVNASTKVRQRMTLAHELGHWLTGDSFDNGAEDVEPMMNSFAIHFLAPRSGVSRVWNQYKSRGDWEALVAVAATYQISWSAAVNQARNLDLVTEFERKSHLARKPTLRDVADLGLTWGEMGGETRLSPAIAAACDRAAEAGLIPTDRVDAILRGTRPSLSRAPLSLAAQYVFAADEVAATSTSQSADTPTSDALEQQARKRMLAEIPMLPDDAVVRATASSSLLVIDSGDRSLVPAFQFDESMTLRPIAAEINAALGARADPWGALAWWTGPAGNNLLRAELAGDEGGSKVLRAILDETVRT